MKYRLYIDEVGNPDLGASADPNHRYLSLTGVILDLAYVDNVVFPALEALKRKFFGSHPDDPIVLHRKELVNKKPPFEALQDPAAEAAFNCELLALFQTWDYTVLTVVIDKLEHQQRYRTWRFDPYHYCLTVMVERYILWLRQRVAQGDVMSESRGGKEDRRLKDSFERVCQEGSDFVPPDQFQAHLTSRQLKVKSKANNIAGLQLADLMAHASFRATLARREGRPLAANFGGQIAAILEASKYHRNAAGVIEGWGRKWLP
jgi:hypothetical protein